MQDAYKQACVCVYVRRIYHTSAGAVGVAGVQKQDRRFPGGRGPALRASAFERYSQAWSLGCVHMRVCVQTSPFEQAGGISYTYIYTYIRAFLHTNKRSSSTTHNLRDESRVHIHVHTFCTDMYIQMRTGEGKKIAQHLPAFSASPLPYVTQVYGWRACVCVCMCVFVLYFPYARTSLLTVCMCEYIYTLICVSCVYAYVHICMYVYGTVNPRGCGYFWLTYMHML